MKLPDKNPAREWSSSGFRYYPLSLFYRKQFGGRIRKISLDAGFGCPNVDGTVGRGGCIFCNIQSFSPSRRGSTRTISQQIDDAIWRLRGRYRADGFLAYFQPATNTYAPPERLRAVYEEALAHPEVVGLAIGTRPDCAGEEVLDLLAELAERTWLLVEYGLQSIHDRSLAWMNRGHRVDAFFDAVERTRRRGLRFGAHVILGLPGETAEDMIATAKTLAKLNAHSVKIHNLYAARDTRLAEEVAAGNVILPTQEAYLDDVIGFLEHLSPHCVIDRLLSNAPPEYLVAPPWCLEGAAVRQAIEAELLRRDTWQGRLWKTGGENASDLAVESPDRL